MYPFFHAINGIIGIKKELKDKQLGAQMTLLEQLEISINIANYIKDETQEGIAAILDNALTNDEFAIVDDKYELNVYSLSSVFVDKVLILEVATILEKGFKKLIVANNIVDGWFINYKSICS